MTRDKAIEILCASVWSDCGGSSLSEKWVDAFIALGMLKLEESARERFVHECRVHPKSWLDPNVTLSTIDKLGLKLVDKSVVKLFLEEFRACDECKKVAPIYVMDVIERAGLKLVEK